MRIDATTSAFEGIRRAEGPFSAAADSLTQVSDPKASVDVVSCAVSLSSAKVTLQASLAVLKAQHACEKRLLDCFA